mgnify:CR=1 FL=1
METLLVKIKESDKTNLLVQLLKSLDFVESVDYVKDELNASPEEDERLWQQMTTEQFLEGFAEEDSIYDKLWASMYEFGDIVLTDSFSVYK